MSAAKDQIALMARYHAWATVRLLDAITPVPEEEYRKPRGLFFGSIHGTLNHLLLADSGIWYPRLTGGDICTLPLDGEMEPDRTALAERLGTETARWAGYVASLDDAALAGDLHYTMTTGQQRSLPLAATLLHVFNHATHHRGQITTALTMMGYEFEPLDLPYLVFAEQG